MAPPRMELRILRLLPFEASRSLWHLDVTGTLRQILRRRLPNASKMANRWNHPYPML